MRSPLRYAGVALAGAGAVLVLMAARPDVLVSAAGDVVAVRGADGHLSAVKFGSDTLSVREWLAADGDDRLPTDRSVAAGFACDADGCVARLRDGVAVAVSRTPAALADDCARAALVVTIRVPPRDCAAKVLDRPALRRGGATAFTHANGGFDQISARPEGYDRPWAPAPPLPRRETVPSRPGDERDATPPAPDIDAEP